MSAVNQNPNYKILIVDDSKPDRDLFSHFVKQVGYKFDTASNAAEALSKMTQTEFDLILCDYFMPNMTGYELLVKIRENPKFGHVIVIIVTSDESEDTKIKLLKAGANDFVHKGVSNIEIMARIKTHLKAKEVSSSKAVLETAGKFANDINQPLSVMMAALDLLKDKVETDVITDRKNEFLVIVKNVNEQIDAMSELVNNIKKLDLDVRKHYKFEVKRY